MSTEDGRVQFPYRDRTDDDTAKTTSVPADEFIRRFLRHVLPPSFMRIRHYGLLASRNIQELLKRCREQLGVQAPVREERSVHDWMLELTGVDITKCPACGASPLERIELPTLSAPRLSIYNRPANNRAPPECTTG